MPHPSGPGRTEPPRRVRVRARRLDQIDEAKLATAVALMARRLLAEEQTAARAAKENE